MKILLSEGEIHNFLPSLTPKTLACTIIILRQGDSSRERLTQEKRLTSLTFEVLQQSGQAPPDGPPVKPIGQQALSLHVTSFCSLLMSMNR